jgi:cytoskeletal protein CcmA (bactofilin family)
MFGRRNKKETIIADNCIIESNLNTGGNIKIYGKINGSIKVDGDVFVGETGVVLGKVEAKNLFLEGSVEGDVHCKNALKLSSSAKLSGDAYVKNFSSEEGCLFAGKCVMEGMEKIKEKGNKIDKNFDTSLPKRKKKAEIISELESTEIPK